MLCESVSWHPRNHQWVHWHIDCTDSSSLLYQRLLQTHRPGIDVVLPPFPGGSWAGRTTGDTALGCQRGVVQDGENGPRNRRFAGWAVLGGANFQLSGLMIQHCFGIDMHFSGESRYKNLVNFLLCIRAPLCWQFTRVSRVQVRLVSPQRATCRCWGDTWTLGRALKCRWNGCFLCLGAMLDRWTQDTLSLFHDLPDENLLRLCQHLQLLPTIQQGERHLPQPLWWNERHVERLRPYGP